MRNAWISAIADDTNEKDGVAVVGSFQMSPQSSKPFKIRAMSHTSKTVRRIDVRLSREEAQQLVEDWISFGLFGRHGRVETGKP